MEFLQYVFLYAFLKQLRCKLGRTVSPIWEVIGFRDKNSFGLTIGSDIRLVYSFSCLILLYLRFVLFTYIKGCVALRSWFYLKESHIYNAVFILYLSVNVRTTCIQASRDVKMETFGVCYKIYKPCYGQLQAKMYAHIRFLKYFIYEAQIILPTSSEKHPIL